MSQESSRDIFDVRVVEHSIRRGTVTRAEYRAHLASLPDEAEHGEATTTQFRTPFEARNGRPESADPQQ